MSWAGGSWVRVPRGRRAALAPGQETVTGSSRGGLQIARLAGKKSLRFWEKGTEAMQKMQYQAGYNILVLLEVIGWIVAVGALTVIFVSLASNNRDLEIIFLSGAAIPAGLFQVALSQIGRAVLDQANRSRQLLEIFQREALEEGLEG